MKGGGSAYKREKFDIFISHASEDKENIARPLTKALYRWGYNVFLDELFIKMGDSISSRINVALNEADHCIVILSQAFFSKPWAVSELQSIINMNISQRKRILPIWHGITHDKVVEHVPLLADFRAADSSDGIDRLVYQIRDAVGEPPARGKRKTNFIWGFSDFNDAVQVSILKNIVRGASDVELVDYHNALEDIALFLDSLDCKQMNSSVLQCFYDAQKEIEKALREDINSMNDV